MQVSHGVARHGQVLADHGRHASVVATSRHSQMFVDPRRTPPAGYHARNHGLTCFEQQPSRTSDVGVVRQSPLSVGPRRASQGSVPRLSQEKATSSKTPQSAKADKGLKRKLFSPGSGSEEDGTLALTIQPGPERKSSTPKRRRSLLAGEGSPTPVGGTPKTPGRLVPLSERQQMALLMQMTAEESHQQQQMQQQQQQQQQHQGQSPTGDLSPRPSSPHSAGKRTPLDKKVNKRNERGETALHVAAIRGDVKQARRLIKAGADVNVRDYAGWTPLHEACNHGWLDIAKQLLKAGANVNVQGLDNDTPLHDAAINGHRKLVELLLRHGANPLQANTKGKSPLDVAANDLIVKLLRNELIASSSSSSSPDEVRSPTSPESNASDKGEEDGLCSTTTGSLAKKLLDKEHLDLASSMSARLHGAVSGPGSCDLTGLTDGLASGRGATIAGLGEGLLNSRGSITHGTSGCHNSGGPPPSAKSSDSHHGGSGGGMTGSGGTSSGVGGGGGGGGGGTSSNSTGGSHFGLPSTLHHPLLQHHHQQQQQHHHHHPHHPAATSLPSSAPPPPSSALHTISTPSASSLGSSASSLAASSSSSSPSSAATATSSSSSSSTSSSILKKVHVTHHMDKSSSPRLMLKFHHIKSKESKRSAPSGVGGGAPMGSGESPKRARLEGPGGPGVPGGSVGGGGVGSGGGNGSGGGGFKSYSVTLRSTPHDEYDTPISPAESSTSQESDLYDPQLEITTYGSKRRPYLGHGVSSSTSGGILSSAAGGGSTAAASSTSTSGGAACGQSPPTDALHGTAPAEGAPPLHSARVTPGGASGKQSSSSLVDSSSCGGVGGVADSHGVAGVGLSQESGRFTPQFEDISDAEEEEVDDERRAGEALAADSRKHSPPSSAPSPASRTPTPAQQSASQQHQLHIPSTTSLSSTAAATSSSNGASPSSSVVPPPPSSSSTSTLSSAGRNSVSVSVPSLSSSALGLSKTGVTSSSDSRGALSGQRTGAPRVSPTPSSSSSNSSSSSSGGPGCGSAAGTGSLGVSGGAGAQTTGFGHDPHPSSHTAHGGGGFGGKADKHKPSSSSSVKESHQANNSLLNKSAASGSAERSRGGGGGGDEGSDGSRSGAVSPRAGDREARLSPRAADPSDRDHQGAAARSAESRLSPKAESRLSPKTEKDVKPSPSTKGEREARASGSRAEREQHTRSPKSDKDGKFSPKTSPSSSCASSSQQQQQQQMSFFSSSTSPPSSSSSAAAGSYGPFSSVTGGSQSVKDFSGAGSGNGAAAGKAGLKVDVNRASPKPERESRLSTDSRDSRDSTRDSPRSDKDGRPTSPKVPPLKIIIPPKATTAAVSTGTQNLKTLLTRASLPYVLNPTQESHGEMVSNDGITGLVSASTGPISSTEVSGGVTYPHQQLPPQQTQQQQQHPPSTQQQQQQQQQQPLQLGSRQSSRCSSVVSELEAADGKPGADGELVSSSSCQDPPQHQHQLASAAGNGGRKGRHRSADKERGSCPDGQEDSWTMDGCPDRELRSSSSAPKDGVKGDDLAEDKESSRDSGTSAGSGNGSGAAARDSKEDTPIERRVTRSTFRSQQQHKEKEKEPTNGKDDPKEDRDSGSNHSNGRSSGSLTASKSDQDESHVHPRKRKLRQRQQLQSANPEPPPPSPVEDTHLPIPPPHHLEKPANPYELYLDIRKKVASRRSQQNVVTPKAPQGFKDYLMVSCNYVLQGNAASRLAVPMLSAPTSLSGPVKDMFLEQEKARYKLRLQHVIEREKLMLAIEQEIVRVHGRAARALVNQSTPLSVCAILRDEEVYNNIESEAEERERSARSRYNGRQFLSWLQDVDDKYDKIKEALLMRHHHEAESLYAVQKLEWEWKLKEMGLCDPRSVPIIDELHVPMVQVSDEFDLLPA